MKLFDSNVSTEIQRGNRKWTNRVKVENGVVPDNPLQTDHTANHRRHRAWCGTAGAIPDEVVLDDHEIEALTCRRNRLIIEAKKNRQAVENVVNPAGGNAKVAERVDGTERQYLAMRKNTPVDAVAYGEPLNR